MRDAVARRVGSTAVADKVMTKIASTGLSVLASNPLMLGLITHTLTDGGGGVDEGSSLEAATATTVTMYAIGAMIARASAHSGVAGVSADERVMMSDVAQLGARSLLRFCSELMLSAHVRRTREVSASDVGESLVAAGAATHEPTGASTTAARLTAALWLCARARLIPPLEPRGDASIGCFHLIPQEALAAEALAVRLRAAVSTACGGCSGVSAALAAAAHAVLGGDGLPRLDEAWWHPVVIALFEQLRDDAAEEVAAKEALLDAIASRRPEPLVKGMSVDYFDEECKVYLCGQIAATPPLESALVGLLDQNGARLEVNIAKGQVLLIPDRISKARNGYPKARNGYPKAENGYLK